MTSEQPSEKTVILARKLSEFLDINVQPSKIEAISLDHYSFSKEAAELDRYAVLGNALLAMESSLLAISQNVKEDEVSLLTTRINRRLTELLTRRLISSSLYASIGFGPGTTTAEKSSPSTLEHLVQVSVGMAANTGEFVALHRKLSALMTGITLTVNKDSKTKLQEGLQKRKLPLPTYKVISQTGPSHDLSFTVECAANGRTALGEGKSKKLAEGDAAQRYLLAHMPQSEDPSLTLLAPSLGIHRQGLSGRPYFNEATCQAFDIASGTDLRPCFIPARLRNASGWAGRSNRVLAIHGANVLDYLVSHFVIRRNDLLPSSTKAFRATIARSVLNASGLIKTVNERPSQEPYSRFEETARIEYQADCIQSLFALSFLDCLAAENIERFLSSPAATLIKRRVLHEDPDPEELNKNNTSLAVERYGKLGFCYELIRSNDQPELRFTHLKSGRAVAHVYCSDAPTYKLKKQEASKTMLSVIDAFEGVLPPHRYGNKQNFSKYEAFCEFLTRCMVDDRKAVASSDIEKEIYKRTSSYVKEYEGLPFDELIEMWIYRESLSMERQAELLARIRVWTGIDRHIAPLHEYCYLPIVFDAHYDSGRSSSIIDYSDSDEAIVLEAGLTFDIEPEQRVLRSRKTQAKFETLAIANERVKKPKLADRLKEYESRFASMTCAALESIWSQRGTLFETSEEAAVLLSLLRYERGIDIHRLSCESLVRTEIIETLGLPSLFVVDQSTPTCNITDSRKGSYEPLETDTRVKKLSERVIRRGQAKFRADLFSIYDRCCITSCTVAIAMEAAHIAPYRGEKDNHIKNGILLRADIHKLFDANLIGICPDDLSIHISKALERSDYSSYSGIKLGIAKGVTPSTTALRYRWQYYCDQNEMA